MTIMQLVIAPDPRLKTPASKVTEFSPALKQLAEDMFETMYHERGIGLAAVQVGVMKRLLVADVEWGEGKVPGEQWALVNPEIVHISEDLNVYKEGCLSFPEQYAEVERPLVVKVKYQDLDGNQHEKEFTGLLGTCIQHEIDHLNGIVFVDHVSRVKRDMIIRRLNKMKKLGYFDHDHVHGEHCNH